MSETDIQSDILKALREHPYTVHVWRLNNGGVKGTKRRHNRHWGEGTPTDIIGQLRGGAFFAMEVDTDEKGKGRTKAEKARVEEQSAFLDSVRRFGGYGARVRSQREAIEVLVGWQARMWNLDAEKLINETSDLIRKQAPGPQSPPSFPDRRRHEVA